MEDNQKPLTRRARRTTSGANTKEEKNSKTQSPMLRWLKWVLIPVVLLLFLVVGMMLGYSVFGEKEVNKGKKPEELKERPAIEVLQPSTWKHMWDLIFKTE